LKEENQRLWEEQEDLRKENGLFRKRLEEAKACQKTVYRDRIVRAMACQDCRKSEYEKKIRHLKRLRCMTWCLWGAGTLLVFLVLYLLNR